MTPQTSRTDAATDDHVDASSVRKVAPSTLAPAAASVRSLESDLSGSAGLQPSVRAAKAARRPGRAANRPARWPHITAAIAVPIAGAAGFIAAVTTSTVPLEIVTYAVVGGFVIVKVAGPVRAVIAALAAAAAKVGGR
jgi:hypothetical protein